MNNARTCLCGETAHGGCLCVACGSKLAGIARILISLIFVIGGVQFLLDFNARVAWLDSAEYVIPLFGMLPGILMAVVALVLKLGGGVALLVGFKASRAAALLALYVILATLMFHVGEGELTNALKNLAVIGGLLYVTAFGGGAWGICAKQKSEPVEPAATTA